jgi:hypothetical protein
MYRHLISKILIFSFSGANGEVKQRLVTLNIKPEAFVLVRCHEEGLASAFRRFPLPPLPNLSLSINA